MIPIRDTVPNHRPPVALYALLGANVLVFLLQSALPEDQLLAFVDLFAEHPNRFFGAGEGEGALRRLPLVAGTLVTSQFLHGSLLHLVGNLWTLWIFGDNVEDRMGSARFIAFYLACGILAGLAHLASDPGSSIPTLGASGAIAGVMGAYLFLFPRAKVVLLVPLIVVPLFFTTSAVVFLAAWFALQWVMGTAQVMAGEQVAGVAHWAHVGGFAAGALIHRAFVLPLPRRRRLFPDEQGPFGSWS
jgi:membrane associated rhomboid family serine protease